MIVKYREARGKATGLKALAIVWLSNDESMDQLVRVGRLEG